LLEAFLELLDYFLIVRATFFLLSSAGHFSLPAQEIILIFRKIALRGIVLCVAGNGEALLFIHDVHSVNSSLQRA